MTRCVVVALFGAIAIGSLAYADAPQSMARCRVEYLKNEVALRSRQDDFYDACMQADGYKKTSVSCASTDERCYGGSKKTMYFSRATDWLKRQREFAAEWLKGDKK